MTTPKHTITDLYDHLLETLDDLRDETKPLDLDRAHAIAQVAQTAVNVGRLECYYLEVVGGTGTGFITEAEDERPSMLKGTTRSQTPLR